SETRHDDELATAALAYPRHDGIDAVDNADQVDVDLGVDILGPEGKRGCLLADTGAGDEQVYGPEFRFQARGRLTHTIHIRDIRCLLAERFAGHLGSKRGQTLRPQIDSSDGGALGGQPLRKLPADAAAGAGDESDTILKDGHDVFPPRTMLPLYGVAASRGE